MITHRIPLHSGEPRAQHAPRGPDGCLLPSLQPRPHPNLHPPQRPPPPAPYTPASCRANLSVPPWIYPSLTDAHARTHTQTALHELHHINYKLYTHDTWSLRIFGVGTPSACSLWVHVVKLKQRNKPSSPPCLKLYFAVVSFSWTPGYFSVQAIMRCLFINIIDDETQSSICWWRWGVFVWKSRLHDSVHKLFERVLCLISNSSHWHKTYIQNL